MNSPVGDYVRQGGCYLQSEGQVRIFPDEMALERFVMACPHPEVVTSRMGFEYCTRCWAMPRKKVGA